MSVQLCGQPSQAALPRSRASLRSILPSAISAALTFIVIGFWLVAKRVPLGHDEAVYLLRARFLAGAPGGSGDGYWAAYRAPGLPAVLSVPMRLFGESISISRSVVVLIGALTVVAIGWWVGRLAGVTAGRIAPWIVVMTSAFTSYASLILLDVPGTFFVVVAALAIERATVGGRVAWWPALLVPVAAVASVYMRFGTTTSLAAVVLAVLVPRANTLLAANRRVQNFIRLTVVGALSAGLSTLVLTVPALTGSSSSPLRLQRLRQEAKGLSPWASYGDTLDLLWPNGSRSGETFSSVVLFIVVIGTVLTLIAATIGCNRQAAFGGLVGTVVFFVGLNFALAQMFGGYLGLGVPFFALLVSPGYAWVWDRLGGNISWRRGAWVTACVITVVACTQVLRLGSNQVESQRRMEQMRWAGSLINDRAPDQQCAILTSYVQTAWYGNCFLSGFNRLVPGYYADYDPAIRGVFDLNSVDKDHVYVFLVDRGKRQPKGPELEQLMSDSELVAEIDGGRRKVSVLRIVNFGPRP